MAEAEILDRIIRERRSIRAFRPEPVPRAMIEELLEVARWAPSGSNAQPWRVTTLAGARAERLRQRLVEAAGVRSWSEEQKQAQHERIARGPMAWILACIDKPVWEFLIGGSMRFFGAPVALLVSYPGQRGSATPAGVHAFVTTLMLAAHARGLGTVWLGWPLGQGEVIRDEFELPEDEQPGAFLAVGYPDPDARVNLARSPRYDVASFARWLGWD